MLFLPGWSKLYSFLLAASCCSALSTYQNAMSLFLNTKSIASQLFNKIELLKAGKNNHLTNFPDWQTNINHDFVFYMPPDWRLNKSPVTEKSFKPLSLFFFTWHFYQYRKNISFWPLLLKCWIALTTRAQLFKRWIALSTRWITIYWIAQILAFLIIIHWIVIYPVDSAIQLLRNWGQINHWVLGKPILHWVNRDLSRG